MLLVDGMFTLAAKSSVGTGTGEHSGTSVDVEFPACVSVVGSTCKHDSGISIVSAVEVL